MGWFTSRASKTTEATPPAPDDGRWERDLIARLANAYVRLEMITGISTRSEWVSWITSHARP